MAKYGIVVDDDEDCRQEILNVFPMGGLETCKEFDSEISFQDDFLSNLRAYRDSDMPAIVFLDVRMDTPRSGIDLLRSIRRKRKMKSVPIVMISNSSEADDIGESYRLGANLYISKGEDPDDLTEAVQKLLELLERYGKIPADYHAL